MGAARHFRHRLGGGRPRAIVLLEPAGGFLRFLDLSGPKPPLVLVHGLGAFSYAIDDHAASIAALLDARGLREVAVLGHSMGGAVAIALACTRPDLVAPLVLAEAPLDPTPGVVSGPTLAYSETDFARRGHADLVRLLVWQGDETYAGAFQTASPIAIHRTAGSLLAPRSPTPREMLLGLPMPHVSLFGKSLADPRHPMAARTRNPRADRLRHRPRHDGRSAGRVRRGSRRRARSRHPTSALRPPMHPGMIPGMPMTRPRRPWMRAGLLFVGHAVNDGYGGFFAPLLPLLIERLDLSLTTVGLLGTLRILTNSSLQPALGHLIDRAERPSLVVVGPLLTVIAMSFVGRAANVATLVALLVVAGVGTALFHPAAASLVTADRSPRAGLLMAFFSAGGAVGSALAPLAVIPFATAFSLERTPWLALPGAALIAAFALRLRGLPREAPPPRPHAAARAPIPARVFILWTAIMLAATSAVAFSSFLAVLVTERGGSAWLGGAALSTFLISGAAVEFLAGNLSDRHGRRAIMASSLALATPFLLAFLRAPTAFLLPAAALGGGFSLAYSPVGVVAAHECAPGRTGLVSGLVMGLAWGIGGITLTPIGWLADRYGLVPVMTVVAFLPLVAAALLLFYPEPSPHRVAGVS